jgi:hypothetical protein
MRHLRESTHNGEQIAPPQQNISQTGGLSDVVIAAVVAAGLNLGLIWFSFVYKDGSYQSVLIFAGIVGTAIGWIVGIIISPYNNEEKRFSELAKVVYGFLTGYVVSKVDPLLNKLLRKDEIDTTSLIVIAYFVSSLVLSIALTYITRSYWISIRKKYRSTE